MKLHSDSAASFGGGDKTPPLSFTKELVVMNNEQKKIILNLISDEIERHNVWLLNKDFVCLEEQLDILKAKKDLISLFNQLAKQSCDQLISLQLIKQE